MPYNNEKGFIPYTMEQIWDIIIKYVNNRTGEQYTYESFVGTNYYVGYYPLVQVFLEQQEDISNIWGKLNDVFEETNSKILEPQITKNSLISAFLLKGVNISIKNVINPAIDYANIQTKLEGVVGGGSLSTAEANEMLMNLDNIKNSAGNIYCCIDLENYNDISKQEICKIFNNHTPYGLIFQGTEVEQYNLLNGDIFNYKWELPTNINMWLKVDIKINQNNINYPVESISEIKAKLKANLLLYYKLGLDFTPEKYLEINKDLPFASEIKLFWSLNPNNLGINDINDWTENIKISNYTDKLLFDLENKCIINIL